MKQFSVLKNLVIYPETYKANIKKVRRPPMGEWEKIFANHVADKEFASRKYKDLLQLNNKKATQFKDGQRICTDNSLKKVFKYPITTRKGV